MLEIKGIRFEVEITRKRIKNMYLRVNGDKLMVSAPYLMPEWRIYRFLEEKRDWIYKAYEKSSQKQKRSLIYREGDVFYLYGKPFKLIRINGKKNVEIDDDTIVLTYKEDSTEDIRFLYKYLDKYLLKQAEVFFNQYQYILEDYGYHQIPEISCRVMSSKWGVCYTRKNKIVISSYLIHYPLDCLEYIVLHELTHFIIPNHSRRFYDIIERNMPEYKTSQKKLKQ
ncbi:MAG: M48 family metallopeptidase [Erysipelotrichaceae bacterium]|nr:M48 family metallopeptidase [Erysipelotrichaceae bacterium]